MMGVSFVACMYIVLEVSYKYVYSVGGQLQDLGWYFVYVQLQRLMLVVGMDFGFQ